MKNNLKTRYRFNFHQAIYKLCCDILTYCQSHVYSVTIDRDIYLKIEEMQWRIQDFPGGSAKFSRKQHGNEENLAGGRSNFYHVDPPLKCVAMC